MFKSQDFIVLNLEVIQTFYGKGFDRKNSDFAGGIFQ